MLRTIRTIPLLAILVIVGTTALEAQSEVETELIASINFVPGLDVVAGAGMNWGDITVPSGSGAADLRLDPVTGGVTQMEMRSPTRLVDRMPARCSSVAIRIGRSL